MEAKSKTENPVCTSGYDLPTPPWGNDGGADPGEPHPDEPGVREYGREASDGESQPAPADG
jgi:hypothetical protein